jgi:hypothetical protein
VPDSTEAQRLIDVLGDFGAILAIKLYRLTLPSPPQIPMLPCLDHEASLHEGIAPHLAVYVQDRTAGDLHELVFIPAKRQIEVDTVSTWGECSPQSHRRTLEMLAAWYPEYRVKVTGPSWLRGERRVAVACRAQIPLRDVLLSADVDSISRRITRLEAIGSLMEKQSRVASWGVRTVMSSALAVAGVALFAVLGALVARIGEARVAALRYWLIATIGGTLLYYGLKAVQLTEISNRVWKRAVEYRLILSERQRIAAANQTHPSRT